MQLKVKWLNNIGTFLPYLDTFTPDDVMVVSKCSLRPLKKEKSSATIYGNNSSVIALSSISTIVTAVLVML